MGWHGDKQCTFLAFTSSMAEDQVTCKLCGSLLPADYLSENQLVHRRLVAKALADSGEAEVKRPQPPAALDYPDAVTVPAQLARSSSTSVHEASSTAAFPNRFRKSSLA